MALKIGLSPRQRSLNRGHRVKPCLVQAPVLYFHRDHFASGFGEHPERIKPRHLIILNAMHMHTDMHLYINKYKHIYIYICICIIYIYIHIYISLGKLE